MLPHGLLNGCWYSYDDCVFLAENTDEMHQAAGAKIQSFVSSTSVCDWRLF